MYEVVEINSHEFCYIGAREEAIVRTQAEVRRSQVAGQVGIQGQAYREGIQEVGSLVGVLACWGVQHQTRQGASSPSRDQMACLGRVRQATQISSLRRQQAGAPPR